MNKKAIFFGVNSKQFDLRRYNVNKEDLHKICRDFRIGKLVGYNEESENSISHSNFILFIKTTRSKYVLKFYPNRSPRHISKEFVLNRFVRRYKFSTPFMYNSQENHPFIKINNHLVTCYRFLEGAPLYLEKLNSEKVKKINSGIYRLNYLLQLYLTKKLTHHLLNTESFEKKIETLIKISEQIEPYPEKKFIYSVLQNIYDNYLTEPYYFIKRPLHSNIALSNLLYYENQIFFLDFWHVRIDYVLNDLASLVVSCYLLDIPKGKISELINGYFNLNNLEGKKIKVLNIFVILFLLKEYLKSIKRQNCVNSYLIQTKFSSLYKVEIQKYKSKLINLIKNLTYQNKYYL